MSLELEVEPLDFFRAMKLVGLWAIIRGITRSVTDFLPNRLSSEDLLPTTESALRGFRVTELGWLLSYSCVCPEALVS